MQFLTGQQLSAAIHEILRQDDLLLAVAFWGGGAKERLVGKRARVICNLACGGTNPHAIKTLIETGALNRETLRQCDTLHAKVYISEQHTIVASANLSTNGLGLDGVEQAFWEEAGVEIESTAEIRAWFEKLWSRSNEVTDGDLLRIAPIYGFRQRVKPTLRSIEQFDVEQSRLPLIRRTADNRWSTNEEAVIEAFGHVNDIIRRRIDFGIEIMSSADLSRLKDRWILSWAPDSKSTAQVGWNETSDLVVPQVFQYEGFDEKYDVLLSAEVSSPEPFNVADRRFVLAFGNALRKFDSFREFPWEGDTWNSKYYSRQEPVLRSFWLEVKTQFTAIGSQS